MDDLVPQDHLLRLIHKAIDWNFIYGIVQETYSPDKGMPSMDPVMLIKIPFIQYLYGIRSMRQTMKEIEVNVAYRWFLGLEMTDRNGWIPGYTVSPGNLHDSRTLRGLYDKIKGIGIEILVADAGYKSPGIAKLLIDDGIKP